MSACPLQAMCGQGRADVQPSAWARWVVVLLLLLHLRFLPFLIPRFSAVFDFGQEFANTFNVFVGPNAKLPAEPLHFGRRNLPGGNIPSKADMADTDLGGGLSRSVTVHYDVILHQNVWICNSFFVKTKYVMC